ncbi:PAS domain-containing protein [Archangium violaceum]|uniref:ATP-binding protein n=1 Tax=Archangium violaceum TaxID=83451 RepID=UPI00195246D7|nr:ATP-binding protein [Archangium violaceum]QRN95137.1 PAS domain-containing protein [Archangium violaceum]
MWGSHPDVEAPPARQHEARPEGGGTRPGEVADARLLVMGEPHSDLAGVKAMLAPLGQPVHETVDWNGELEALLDMELACILVDARQGWSVGVETALRLRDQERTRHIPLLLLATSACDRADLLRCCGLSTVDCLLEPIHPEFLRAKVGMFIELHRRERTLRAALDRAERAEAVARESERMLRTLLGNLPGMAYRCHDTPGYPFSYASPGALELTGYGPEDFTSHRVSREELIHPDDLRRVREGIQMALDARTPITLTYRIRTRTGKERWVWERGVAIHEEPQAELPILEGFITDITPLHRAEQEREELLIQARAEHGRMETIIQQLPCAVHIAEAPTGRTLAVNARAEQLLGHPMIEVRCLQDFARYRAIHADGSRYTAEEYPIARVLLTGKAQPEEEVLYDRPDGSVRVFLISAGPILDRQGQLQAVVASFIDITGLRRAERRQAFLASVSETLASSLDYEATLAHVVQRAVPVLGDCCTLDMLEPDGSIRRLAVAHVDPGRAELAWELARSYPIRLDSNGGSGAVIRTGKTQLTAEIPDHALARFARDARHLELLRGLRATSALVVPLHARGRTFGALSLGYGGPGHRYGPEEQLLAEELARRAALAVDNARLYREAQLAVQLRDEFLSVASHELKTPLTPLHLKLSALSRELPRCCVGDTRSQGLQRHVDVARRQVHKMSTLINSLLDVSRLSQGKLKLEPEDTDLGEVLAEVAAWFVPEAARVGSELRVEGETRVPGCWDRLRLEQVVTNLISNAIRYGAGRPIIARLEVETDLARLVVRDQGIGIAPEAQERIFGKFERAVSDRHSGGLGLGLYITRSIVEAMGGSIRVESRLGEGSTFTVELPRCQEGR